MSTNSAPQLPVFIPDCGVDDFADSGTRGHLRFVRSGSKVGVYSLKQGARSRHVNRGGIVKVGDDMVECFVTPLTTRESDTASSGNLTFGPELPFSPNPDRSGTISVTASVEQTSQSGHQSINEILSGRSARRKPGRWPLFWRYTSTFTNWLVEDTGPVFYEVSGKTKNEYARLKSIVRRLDNRGGCYIDHAERYIFGAESTKGNAGVDKLMDRETMVVGAMVSAHLHLNMHVPVFMFSTGCVYFLPEQIVIARNQGGLRFVRYSDVSISVTEGSQVGVPVPNWCEPIGYSWMYMNKDGGPDRRYNYNPQLPHYRVWEVDLQFNGGRIDSAFADGKLAIEFADCLENFISLSKGRRKHKG